jgi:hypothetical protein
MSLKSLKCVLEVTETSVILFVVIYTIFGLVAEFTVLLFVQLTVNSRYCTLVLLYKIYVQLTVNSRVRLFFE